MKTTLNAQTIARALGISKQAVHKRANLENWQFAENNVLGGRQRVYALDGLPQAVRDQVDQWLNRSHPVAPKPECGSDQSGADAIDRGELERLAEARRLRLSPRELDDPKTWVKLACWRALGEAPAYCRDGGREDVAQALAARHGVSLPTIWRWAREVEGWHRPRSEPKAIVGNESIPLPKTRKFPEAAVRFGLQTYGQNIRRGAKWAYIQLQQEATHKGWMLGDYSSFTRLLHQVPEVIWAACKQGMVAVERDNVAKVVRSWLKVPAYTVLCGDQNVGDCLAVDASTGEIVVMNDYLWMDCTSRAIVGMWPSFGPYNKYTVAYSLRMAFQRAFADQIYTDWGGPETSHNTADLIKNLGEYARSGGLALGSWADMETRYWDYAGEEEESAKNSHVSTLERGNDQGGVEHRKAQAGIPWHKPIENVMNQYRRYWLDSGAPGFRQRANEPWENKAIQAECKRLEKQGGLWSLEKHLQARLDFMAFHNGKNMKIREGGGQVIVPGQVLARSLAEQPNRYRADERTTDLLFLPRKEITPRQSTVAIKFPDGTRAYAAMELSRVKKGERVFVHADPFDPERPAIITQGGEFYCLAERKKDINPVSREGLGDQIAEQRRLLKWWRAEVENLVGLNVGDRGLVRIGKATQIAKRAEQELAERRQSKTDQRRMEELVIQLDFERKKRQV